MLFSDIEGSTRLLERLGRERYAEALELHRRLLREAFDRHDGFEVNCEGDSFFVAFPTADGAVAAATEAERALGTAEWPEGCELRVRMGLHTGEPMLAPPKYVGLEVHTAARIMAAGHGGQILLSQATRAELQAMVEVRDLGEHRLKDLSSPERIYQLGNDDFPPLKALHQTNLPISPTPFLGRERELREVLALLARDDVRLLTLTGPGGTGKTRLAAQAAGLSSADYPDGVWWVPLAALREPELVLEAAGLSLGSKNGLAEHIADKRLLLLLDNFEHVIDAADDLAAVLAACPKLDLLVTSREPLHVSGEQEYAVLPLDTEESVDFFLARARAVRPDFHADDSISEICRRLDDLPLALELAAARVKALAPAQILARLEQRLPLLTGGARDLPERQRTLRAAISWSYELLSRSEQDLFARLAVFRGGCRLEAAEQVVDADLDLLQSLVDQSLLRHDGARYWMLETIREFAAEQLERAGEAREFESRHAEVFLDFAERSELILRGGDAPDLLDGLEADQDNLRAALDWFTAAGDRACALRLAGALGGLWILRGHVLEGARRLKAALAADREPTSARARALTEAAVIEHGRGNLTLAQRLAEEAGEISRALGDPWRAAYANLILASVAADRGDQTAEELFYEATRSFGAAGDERYALVASYNLAVYLARLGLHERSRRLHEENLDRSREAGAASVEAWSLQELAAYADEDGRTEEALTMLNSALLIERRRGSHLDVVDCLSQVARMLAKLNAPATTVRLVAASEALREKWGSDGLALVAEVNQATLAAVRDRLSADALDAEWEQGRALTIDEAIALALDAAGKAQHLAPPSSRTLRQLHPDFGRNPRGT